MRCLNDDIVQLFSAIWPGLDGKSWKMSQFNMVTFGEKLFERGDVTVAPLKDLG